eukprot:9893640-Ditylum_brightwellii.AAC.1
MPETQTNLAQIIDIVMATPNKDDDKRSNLTKKDNEDAITNHSETLYINNQKNKRRLYIKLYLFLCFYRLLNALLVQTQFDPDEYWQTLEPSYCLVFGKKDINANHVLLDASSNEEKDESGRDDYYECAYTWEWTRRYDEPLDSDGNSNNDNDNNNIISGISNNSSNVVTELIQKAMKGPKFQMDTTFLIYKGPILLHAVMVAAITDLAMGIGLYHDIMVSWICINTDV